MESTPNLAEMNAEALREFAAGLLGQLAQEGIFERAGLAIPRSTLAQWVGICGVRLEPIWLALKAELLARSVLHADETPSRCSSPA